MTTKTTTTITPEYATFDTWDQLLEHIRAGFPGCYHAPVDVRPYRVNVGAFKNGKIRVYPLGGTADRFTADAAHLGRFRRELAQVRPEVAQ